jgi:hypothetical protein
MNLRAFAVLGLFTPLVAFAACQGEINPQPLPPNTSSSGGEFTPGRPSTGASSGGGPTYDAAAPAPPNPADDAGGSFDSDASSDAGPDAPILDAGPDSSDATTD